MTFRARRGCRRHETARLDGVLLDGPRFTLQWDCGCAQAFELVVSPSGWSWEERRT
jgi:hypothetical protein